MAGQRDYPEAPPFSAPESSLFIEVDVIYTDFDKVEVDEFGQMLYAPVTTTTIKLWSTSPTPGSLPFLRLEGGWAGNGKC